MRRENRLLFLIASVEELGDLVSITDESLRQAIESAWGYLEPDLDELVLDFNTSSCAPLIVQAASCIDVAFNIVAPTTWIPLADRLGAASGHLPGARVGRIDTLLSATLFGAGAVGIPRNGSILKCDQQENLDFSCERLPLFHYRSSTMFFVYSATLACVSKTRSCLLSEPSGMRLPAAIR